MKNKLFSLIVISLLCSVYASSQTIHTIIFTDTQDESIGIAARASHDNYTLDFMSTVETAIGTSYNSNAPIDKRGYECNKSNLLRTLQNLSCGEKDIVIFIYVGHGARGLHDWSNFPQMCFAVPRGAMYRNGDDYYPLENVRDLIMKKNPRFCLVIGDCCNSYSPGLSTKNPIPQQEMMAPDVIRRSGEKAIKELFLGNQGSVILTASVKGQYGWCTNSGMVLGMFLERNLNSVFQDIKDGKARFANWEELLATVRTNTYEFSKNHNLTTNENGRTMRWTQTPYYEVKLSGAPIIKEKKKDIVPQTLQQAITQVADSRSYSDTERIAKSRSLKAKYFDNDATPVEVVGKDKKTIIQVTDINRYMLRASTEEDLANIIVIDAPTDANNKVTYLKVHEIYAEPEEDEDFK